MVILKKQTCLLSFWLSGKFYEPFLDGGVCFILQIYLPNVQLGLQLSTALVSGGQGTCGLSGWREVGLAEGEHGSLQAGSAVLIGIRASDLGAELITLRGRG